MDQRFAFFERQGTLWNIRKHACLAFLPHYMAGMVASSIGESANSELKKDLNRAASILSALQVFEQMLVRGINRHNALRPLKDAVDKHPFLLAFGHIIDTDGLKCLRGLMARIPEYRVDHMQDEDGDLFYRVHYANNPDSTPHDVYLKLTDAVGDDCMLEYRLFDDDGDSSDGFDDVVFGGGLEVRRGAIVVEDELQLDLEPMKMEEAAVGIAPLPLSTRDSPTGYIDLQDALDLENNALCCGQCAGPLEQAANGFHPFLFDVKNVYAFALPDLLRIIKSCGYKTPYNPTLTLERAKGYVARLGANSAIDLDLLDLDHPPRPMGNALLRYNVSCDKCSAQFHAMCAGVHAKLKKTWMCLSCLYPRSCVCVCPTNPRLTSSISHKDC